MADNNNRECEMIENEELEQYILDFNNRVTKSQNPGGSITDIIDGPEWISARLNKNVFSKYDLSWVAGFYEKCLICDHPYSSYMVKVHGQPDVGRTFMCSVECVNSYATEVYHSVNIVYVLDCLLGRRPNHMWVILPKFF